MRILAILFVVLSMVALSTSFTSRSQLSPGENTVSMLNADQFTIKADRAFIAPYNVDYVTSNLNAPPLVREGPTRTMINLTPGYYVDFTENELVVYLPYLSRILKTSLKNEDANQFSIKNFKLDKKVSTRGTITYTVLPTDRKFISEIVIEVTKNGKTSIDINPKKPDQSVSFEGFIDQNMALNN